jgi:hypothetical protein
VFGQFVLADDPVRILAEVKSLVARRGTHRHASEAALRMNHETVEVE